jgi:hypothetical protein
MSKQKKQAKGKKNLKKKPAVGTPLRRRQIVEVVIPQRKIVEVVISRRPLMMNLRCFGSWWKSVVSTARE